MPLPNRVTPLGDLIADPARGLVYGNRGCLHDVRGEIRRRHDGKRWISCRLRFRDWHRSPLLQPGRFTELFFLDEATAMAAGHRACRLCRRADFDRLATIWGDIHTGERGADAIDARLHGERLDRKERRLHARVMLDDLPDGAFVLRDDRPHLVRGDALLLWTPAGYRDRRSRSSGPATLITPPSLVAVLRRGWEGVVPLFHPSSDPVAGKET